MGPPKDSTVAEEWYGGVCYRYEKELPPTQKEHWTLKEYLKSAFLPHGYPDSVSKDYLVYQKWDTAQAFCSSITNLLASHALLKGYGVGNATATAGAALMTWMLRDGTAMMGRILFAWGYGTRLDCNSRSWRLFADVLNDMAICVEIAAPNFPSIFVQLACLGSLGKAIVSVAGGATRAALTQHQARRNNMADVSAKDGSQEQMVQLAALLVGLLLSPPLDNGTLPVWPLFVFFTLGHLYCNYMAVSCVVFDTLNEERARIVFKEFLANGTILGPEVVAVREPVLWTPGRRHGFDIHLGARLSALASNERSLAGLLSHSATHQYNLSMQLAQDSSAEKKGDVYVVLDRSVTQTQILASFFHAFILETLVCGTMVQPLRGPKDELELWEKMTKHMKDGQHTALVEISYGYAERAFQRLVGGLESRGWVLRHVLLAADEWRVTLKKND